MEYQPSPIQYVLYNFKEIICIDTENNTVINVFIICLEKYKQLSLEYFLGTYNLELSISDVILDFLKLNIYLIKINFLIKYNLVFYY